MAKTKKDLLVWARVSADWKARILAEAAEEDLSQSDVVRRALRHHLFPSDGAEPSPDEEGWLAELKEIEARSPLLVSPLLRLGRAASVQPHLARVVLELAQEGREDEPGRTVPPVRSGQRRKAGNDAGKE